MVSKPKVRTRHRRPASHPPHAKILAQRFAAPPDMCHHCMGTGDCPGCEGDRAEGCGQCSAFRAGACRACDGQGDHS